MGACDTRGQGPPTQWLSLPFYTPEGAWPLSPLAFISRLVVEEAPTRPEGRWSAPSVHPVSASSSSGFSTFQPIQPLRDRAPRRRPRLHHRSRLRSCLRSRLRSRRRTCGRTKGGALLYICRTKCTTIMNHEKERECQRANDAKRERACTPRVTSQQSGPQSPTLRRSDPASKLLGYIPGLP